MTALLLCCAAAGYSQTQYGIVADPFPAGMSFPSRFISGDFDNDGDADILYQMGNTMGVGVGYMRNNGGGGFTQFANAAVAGTPFATFDFSNQQITSASLFVEDYDGDGDVDVIDRDNVGTGGILGVWRNNAGVFQLAASDPFPTGMTFPARMLFGDFDNDGDTDALFQTGNTMGVGIGYLRNNGSGGYTQFASAAVAGTPFATFDFSNQQIAASGLFVVDYDADGDADIVDRENSGTGGILGVWQNNAGVFQLAASDPFPTGMTFPARMVFGDYDSDGDVDVLYQTGNTMGVGIGYLKHNGGGSYTQFASAAVAGTPFATFDFSNQQITPTGLYVLDYDADGDLDIADRENSGTGGVLGMWSVGGAPPRLTASTPANNATGVSTTANIVLTFSEPVVSAGGQLYIRRANGSLFATITTNNAQVTGQSTNTITINPTANLEGNTTYHLTFDRNAFADNEGHVFAELSPEDYVLRPIMRNNFLSFTTSTPLPVRLISFIATTRGQNVVLDWRTAAEYDAAYFDVEYSVEGLNYRTAGRIESKGDAAPATYQLLHENPGTGNLYYRLKQVDEDGSASYSQVCKVYLTQDVSVQVAPNPVKDILQITAQPGSFNTLRLVDIQGRLLQEEKMPAGGQLVLQGMSQRPAGLYVVELTGNAGRKQIKITKD